jgi:hypothetical protein
VSFKLSYACVCINSVDSRPEKYLKKLLGKMDIEDALRRLDQLTQEEVRMATARLLTLTHGVDSKVARIDDEVKGVNERVKDVSDTVKVVLDGA